MRFSQFPNAYILTESCVKLKTDTESLYMRPLYFETDREFGDFPHRDTWKIQFTVQRTRGGEKLL